MKLSFIKANGGLAPADPSTEQALQKIKTGSVVECDITRKRNPRFHRKFFALLNFTYDRWEPVGGLVSNQEKRILERFAGELGKFMDSPDLLNELVRDYLQSIELSRSKCVQSCEKSFEAFRREIMIQSGQYVLVQAPSGTRKEAKSISFANMDDVEFGEVYKSVFSTCWNMVLKETFENENEAQNAIDNLLNFG